MESNFLLNDFDIVLNKQKNNRVINEEEKKNENSKDNIIKICYDKKWLILLGLLMLLTIMYIYYYNISITIPSVNLNNFKFNNTPNKTCDDITDFDDSNIKWDIETEIMNYIKLQDEYIASKNT